MSILQSLDAPLSVALEALSMLLCLLDVQPQAGPVHIESMVSGPKGMVQRLAKDGGGKTC